MSHGPQLLPGEEERSSVGILGRATQQKRGERTDHHIKLFFLRPAVLSFLSDAEMREHLSEEEGKPLGRKDASFSPLFLSPFLLSPLMNYFGVAVIKRG